MNGGGRRGHEFVTARLSGPRRWPKGSKEGTNVQKVHVALEGPEARSDVLYAKFAPGVGPGRRTSPSPGFTKNFVRTEKEDCREKATSTTKMERRDQRKEGRASGDS